MSDLYIKAVAPSVSRSTATLMKTGQTTSYRTGDDGDLEIGRATDFLTLAENNPFGNTNRFTSEFGTQTYTNNIVIDWSTYNGVTVLGIYRISFSNRTWISAIDTCLATSVGSFTSGWRLWNINEMMNFMNYGQVSGDVLGYAPIILPVASYWTSTTQPDNSINAIRNAYSGTISIGVLDKTASQRAVSVRTFTVTGTTLS